MNQDLLLAHFDRISEAPDAIPRLRRFILDLAVRGKLVDQNENDEPPQHLLKSMDAKKTQAVVAGGVTKTSAGSFANGYVPFEIPSNWIWVRLGDICSKTGSGSTPRGGRSVYQSNGVPFLRSQNVYDDGLRLDDVAYITHQTHEKMSGTAVQPGDLLLNITGGSIGRCCHVSSGLVQANISQHIAIIRVAAVGIQRYLHRLILSPYFQSFILKEQTGAGRGGLPKNRMDGIPVALPPLAEQHRIVTKVDELMALCDRLDAAQAERNSRRNRLTAAALHKLSHSANAEDFRSHARFCIMHLGRIAAYAADINELRQGILNLAVHGRLIPQDPSDEPAVEVVKRIRAEKAHLAQLGGLKKDKAVWDGLPKGPPYELPSGWVWTSLQDVFEISRGGSPRPAGDPRFFGGNIPWITVGEITKDAGKYLTHTASGLTEEGAARSRFINSGDLLLTNSGATLGVPKISCIRACMNDGVAVLRSFHSVKLNDFAYLYLQSQTKTFRMVNQGMGQPNLNTPIIAGWFFPLPPVAEQGQIVARVDELMALCDRLEEQLTIGQTESRRFLEAILYDALNDNQLACRQA